MVHYDTVVEALWRGKIPEKIPGKIGFRIYFVAYG